MSSKLTEHFSEHEMACRHGLLGNRDNLIIVCQALEVVRTVINKPIFVISGYRCPECNLLAGGVKNSQHLLSKAADIYVENMTIDELGDLIIKLQKEGKIPQGGVGRYYRGKGNRLHEFIHYDIRGRFVEWRQWK
jgi:uncharacterized protein YcbK (DUF882 family)